MTTRKIWTILTVPFLLLGLAACSDSGPTSPDDTNDPPPAEETVLLSVAPEGGSSAVGVDTVITVKFSHPMDPSMSEYADVHEGDITGPEVAGTWEWLEDNTVLRFTPDGLLQPATDYVVHLGAGMMDADGEHVNMEEHGHQMGGEWATDDMMMGGGMGGGMGGNMDPSEHMGGNWDHPSNGSHGMIFTFTTAG
jgi:hypothetical protein